MDGIIGLLDLVTKVVPGAKVRLLSVPAETAAAAA